MPTAIAGFIFVGVGDKFLPQPLGGYSKNVREQINQRLLGVVPDPDLKRPSEEREKEVEKLMN